METQFQVGKDSVVFMDGKAGLVAYGRLAGFPAAAPAASSLCTLTAKGTKLMIRTQALVAWSADKTKVLALEAPKRVDLAGPTGTLVIKDTFVAPGALDKLAVVKNLVFAGSVSACVQRVSLS
jgi:hypothetical protein